MVRVAIYSAGPNLERTMWVNFPIKIAVNAAINRLSCPVEWYCAGDDEAYEPAFTTRRPTVGWCCMSSVYERKILAEYPGWDHLLHPVWADLPALPPRATFSITAAVALAIYLGATDITIFGDDRIDEPRRYDWNRRDIESAALEQIKAANPQVQVTRVL